ncbi:MAG: HD domain-containing protein [Gracilibacteraceae bacterium]|jgi:tRNA nucleotidyltransferase (CCA-adding enzyme)|nr:HD domain-containing protein [Gracilibacteraceae bacterium]
MYKIKQNNKPFAVSFAPPVLEALRLLETGGGEAWVVGGAVRDLLCGRKPKDWDIATSVTPERARAIFADWRVLDTGVRHGTLTVIIRGCPIEVTVYRLPGDAAGATSIENDLAARDFTMNAIAYHPERGILDPQGGRSDLQAGIIRAVGNPAARFQEDALRVLRALRLASLFGYRLAPETASAMRRWGPRLSRVAPERVWREFRLLLCGSQAPEILRRWPDIIGVFLPEMLPMVGFDQHSPYHIFDVYEHTLQAIAHLPPAPDLRLAMFFHDIGKPASFFSDTAGVGHFYGHPRLSADIAAKALKRMRSSRAERVKICALVRWHDLDISCRANVIRRWLRKLGPEIFFSLLKIKRADNLAHHPDHIRPGDMDKIIQTARKIMAESGCYRLADLKINGRDLLELGIPESRDIGRILAALLRAVIDGRCANEKQALLLLAAVEARKLK